MAKLIVDKSRDQQKFYEAIDKALKKHIKMIGLDSGKEVEAIIGSLDTDEVNYFVITPEGKRKPLLKARLTYKPFFVIKRFKP